MEYWEQPVKIRANEIQMLGIVSLPREGRLIKKNAVLIVTGGAQYRVGSHRQFTRMARQLSEEGYAVMRFDLPGMGDSSGLFVPFENITPYIAAAIDVFIRTVGIQRLCLWGLCDGASASLIYLYHTRDDRIAGLVLLNPWIRSEISLAKTYIKYYYIKKILKINFWRKLISGKIELKTMKVFFENLVKTSKILSSTSPLRFQNKMAQGWAKCKAPILLLLSEHDLTAQEFKEYIRQDKAWRQLINLKSVEQHILLKADHTCSTTDSHYQMVKYTVDWLNYINSKTSQY